MLLLLAAVMLLPVVDTIAKDIMTRHHVWQVTWGRFLFTLLSILPALLLRHRSAFVTIRRPGLQLARGLAQFTSTFLFFLTLSYLPLADTVALAFLYPLLVTALSPFVLGERVGWRRYAAVAIGFLGALVIIRPGIGIFQPASLFGIGIGFTFAIYVLLTRKLGGLAPALVTLGWGSSVCVAVSSLFVSFVWLPMAWGDWLGLVAMGVLGALAYHLMIRAYEMAPAAVLSPMGYCEIIGAVILGYAWFGDFPDLLTWLGIVIIAGAGLYVGWRERRRG